MCVCVFVCLYVCTYSQHIYAFVRMCVCVCVCVCVCMYMYIYIYIYIKGSDRWDHICCAGPLLRWRYMSWVG
jgi:hypothetical protein